VTARAVGFPEVPFIVESSNYTQTAPDQIRKDVDRLIDSLIAGLTRPVKAGTGPIKGKIRTQAGYEAPWGQVKLGPVEEEVIRITGKDYDEAYENFQRSFLDWGWSDGLPLIPPTKERVDAMLKGTSHSPDEVITKAWVPGSGMITIKKVAINAVMAGALPAHFPAILAGQQAMVNNRHLIAAQSTSCHAPLFWVNGPIIKQLHFNNYEGSLGPGSQSRVNIAVGRAFRLLMMNIGGVYVGIQDMDVIGSPNKFSMVMAENEEDAAQLGWEPYHVERGFDRNTSTISLQYIGDQTEVIGMSSQSGKGIMKAAANDMGAVSAGLGITGITFYLTGDDARMIIADGWKTKQSIKEYLAENVCQDRESYKVYHGLTEANLIKSGFTSGPICTNKGKAIDFTILRVGADAGKSCYSRQTTYAGKEKTAQPYIVSIDKWK